jgi:hypothetical protein
VEMEENFLKLMDEARSKGDLKREMFLEYIISKYLVDPNLMVSILDVAPLLDKEDLKELKQLDL